MFEGNLERNKNFDESRISELIHDIEEVCRRYGADMPNISHEVSVDNLEIGDQVNADIQIHISKML